MSIKRITIIPLFFIVGACSLMIDKNTHDYPQASKDAFMSSCSSNSGGQKEACSCMLAKVQEHYTYGEMTDLEEKIKKGEKPPEFVDFMNKVRDSCVVSVSPATPSNK